MTEPYLCPTCGMALFGPPYLSSGGTVVATPRTMPTIGYSGGKAYVHQACRRCGPVEVPGEVWLYAALQMYEDRNAHR